MKKKGSVVEFSGERDREILQCYRSCIKERDVIDFTVYDDIVEMPASRFWVSEPRAAAVVSSMLRGDDIPGMNSERRRMYEEIMRRVVILRDENPKMSLTRAVFNVVNSEAPRFYISAFTARSIIYRLQRGGRTFQKGGSA